MEPFTSPQPIPSIFFLWLPIPFFPVQLRGLSDRFFFFFFFFDRKRVFLLPPFWPIAPHFRAAEPVFSEPKCNRPLPPLLTCCLFARNCRPFQIRGKGHCLDPVFFFFFPRNWIESLLWPPSRPQIVPVFGGFFYKFFPPR